MTFFQNYASNKVYHFLDFEGVQIVGNAVELLRLLPELKEAHRLAGNVQTLIDASLAESVLFDGTINDESFESFVVVAGLRNPCFRGHDLG